MTAAAPPPLAIRGLTKEYRARQAEPVRAVADLSLTIGRGECMAILGRNGAGKTSIIHCITGYYPATAGTVLIEGIDVHRDPRRARTHLGVCFQEDCLDPDMSVFEQLVQYARYFGLGGRAAARRAEELLVAFELTDHHAARIDLLSGGTRRRLQVARALVNQPTLVILDEPTTGLDPEARKLVWKNFRDQRDRGVAILLTTHLLPEAEQLADRVGILSHGKLIDLGPPAELIARQLGTDPIRLDLGNGRPVERAPNLEDVFFHLVGRGELDTEP